MVWINAMITALYFVLSGVVAVILVKLWLKEKDLQKAILISVILMPFILRLLAIK